MEQEKQPRESDEEKKKQALKELEKIINKHKDVFIRLRDK